MSRSTPTPAANAGSIPGPRAGPGERSHHRFTTISEALAGVHGLRPAAQAGMLPDMARLPRLDLPDIPQHVVQRGNNRLPCFLDDRDRLRYLQLLRESLAATHCRLHAYVLMDNHIHLLVTPKNAGRSEEHTSELQSLMR